MSSTKYVRVQDLPEETAIAAYELAAKALLENLFSLEIELALTDEGQPVGHFHISIRKTG
jgi:hypothetical protein